MKNLWSMLLFPVIALSGAFAQDAEGCKDHPMLSRMPEYFISDCSNAYNQVEVYTGIVDGERQTRAVEGNVTGLGYAFLAENANKLPSWFQVVKNYSNAIARIGGKKLFSDAEAATFLVTRQGKDIWVSVEIGGAGPDGVNVESYTLKVIEVEAMKQEITANDMLDELTRSGFIALYINFETGKADIKQESQGVVGQIAEMLKANPSLAVAIEGHTDNVGSPASNKKLSENRAQAVMKAVAGKGVDRSRLSARGWGQEKPLADNRTEEGRAKNRRVEIVRQ